MFGVGATVLPHNGSDLERACHSSEPWFPLSKGGNGNSQPPIMLCSLWGGAEARGRPQGWLSTILGVTE